LKPTQFHTSLTGSSTRICFLSLVILFNSCDIEDTQKQDKGERVKVVTNQLGLIIKSSDYSKGFVDDSFRLVSPSWVSAYYKTVLFKPIWTDTSGATKKADTVIQVIAGADLLGLSPQFYHFKNLKNLKQKLDLDTLSESARRDPFLLAAFDLLLTDACLSMAKAIHEGQFPLDSIYGKKVVLKDSVFYFSFLNGIIENLPVVESFGNLEPQTDEYSSLKEVLKLFLDTADLSKTFTYLEYPYKDSISFIHSLATRLKEGGWIDKEQNAIDSATLARAILSFQEQNNLYKDGKAGRQVVRYLNRTNKEILHTISINLDRHRLLQHILPDHYIGVNLPGYYLFVKEESTNVLYSKVVVGKASTQTPLLSSYLTDIVTYPKWTIPQGIIAKEILPSLKRDPGYLLRKGYKLLGQEGEPVDPYSVDWNKYSKGIPYRVVQGSGDDNALGVLKFNFNNPFSVFMHDTNQRYLFNNSNRSLSHGCVRVQEWEKLAYYVLERDSLSVLQKPESKYIKSDSLKTWLARKENRVLRIKVRIPIFFIYITAEGRDRQLVLHEDIYSQDRVLRIRYKG